MKVLVTGGAGFIGSHLVAALLDRGVAVSVLDDFSTGKRSNLPDSHLLTVVEGDVADPEAVRNALQGCTALIHLAAIASVQRSVIDPLGTHRTNLVGSLVVFGEAADMGVRRALYASSAAVYGDATALPIQEASPLEPLTPYAIDKLAGEQYLAYYHRAGQLRATTFRFFNVFGPRQDPSSPYSGVISIFLDRASSGAPITIHGDGLQSRDFIYVGDVVRALLAALDSDSQLEDMPVYNVARGERVTLLDLLSTIEELPGVRSPLQVEHAPRRHGDIRHSLADTHRLRHDLGWRPLTSLTDGLSATLQGEEPRKLPEQA